MSASLQEYAVISIKERLQKAADLIEPVRSGEDPLSIKKMRVASRRLRAALQVFSSEFPFKDFNRFERDVKRVADALAEARDADVMIESVTTAAAAIPESDRAWIGYFINRLKGDRAKLQRRVLDALSFAEKRNLPGRFEEMVFIQSIASPDPASQTDPSDHNITPPPPDAIAASFGRAITARMSELVSFELIIEDPAKVVELHRMRIAAKRLRYTLELYVSHAGERITPYIERIKIIQEFLGNIHDADVLIPPLVECFSSLLGAQKGAGETAGAYMADFAAAEGITQLCRNKQSERDQAYRDFLSEWRKLRAEGYFDSLWSAVKTER